MNSQSYVWDNSKAQCKEESLCVEFFERGGPAGILFLIAMR